MKLFVIAKEHDQFLLRTYEYSGPSPFYNIPSDVVYSSILIVGEDGRVFKNRKGNTGTPVDTVKIRQLAESLTDALGE